MDTKKNDPIRTALTYLSLLLQVAVQAFRLAEIYGQIR
jgi:hypothetical protein